MSDETPDINVRTTPLPLDAAAPTEPIAANEPPVATAAPAPLVQRPTWGVSVVTVLGLALLPVLAGVILPSLLAGRAEPLPGVTPTTTAPTPSLTGWRRKSRRPLSCRSFERRCRSLR